MTVGGITAVILVGGLGMRLRSLFPDTPKGAVQVGGRSFIRLLLAQLRRSGVGRAILLTGYKGDIVESEAAREASEDFEIIYVREPEPLGTGGAVLNAMHELPDTPFVLMNGDTWVEFDPAALIAALPASGGGLAIAASVVDDTSEGGRLEIDPNGRLIAFREKAPGGGLMNAGVYAMTRDTLAPFAGRTKISLEDDIFPELLDAGTDIRVIRVDRGFFDIGTPDRFQRFEEKARDPEENP